MSLREKLNFGGNMNDFTQRKIDKAMRINGKVLPVTVVARVGHMITVSFQLDNIPYTIPEMTVPLFGPEYVRYPMQPGDSGIVIPAATYLGGVSGQGGGVADLTTPPNLSALVFLPISNTEWEDVDYSVLTLYGPEGVTIRDAGSNTTFMLTPDSITIAAPKSYEVTVGATKFTLTTAGWSISGSNASLQEGSVTTSPKLMQEAWNGLRQWLNTHDHPNGNNGNSTRAPTNPYEGDITE